MANTGVNGKLPLAVGNTNPDSSSSWIASSVFLNYCIFRIRVPGTAAVHLCTRTRRADMRLLLPSV